VAVGLVDPAPVAGLAIEALCDRRERVTLLDGVAARVRLQRAFGGRHATLHVAEVRPCRSVLLGAGHAALHVREIGFPVVAHRGSSPVDAATDTVARGALRMHCAGGRAMPAVQVTAAAPGGARAAGCPGWRARG